MPLGGSRGYLRSPRKKRHPWNTTRRQYPFIQPADVWQEGQIRPTLNTAQAQRSTTPTASTQAIGVWSTQKEQIKAKTDGNHQSWSSIKQSFLWRNLRTRNLDGQVGKSFQWTDKDHTPWKTTQPEHNIPETGSTSSQFPDMPQLHLLQKLLRKESKQVRQCHWKCQTPRLRLARQSQRPPWRRKLRIHQTASKHPDQGVSLKHQWNMDTKKTSEATFTQKWLIKDVTINSAKLANTLSVLKTYIVQNGAWYQSLVITN